MEITLELIPKISICGNTDPRIRVNNRKKLAVVVTTTLTERGELVSVSMEELVAVTVNRYICGLVVPIIKISTGKSAYWQQLSLRETKFSCVFYRCVISPFLTEVLSRGLSAGKPSMLLADKVSHHRAPCIR